MTTLMATSVIRAAAMAMVARRGVDPARRAMTTVQATPAAMTATATSSWRSAPRESTRETICQRSTERWAVATMATAAKKSAPMTLMAMRHRRSGAASASVTGSG